MKPVAAPGRAFERLERGEFDLLIVGGGISGSTLAWDASLRGLRVALVDKADFASATSSATSKLIHGGLRYLKNGEVALVRESLAERRILQAIAPHLVWPLPFLIPTQRHGNARWMIWAGMLAYDLLSFDRNRGLDAAHHMRGHSMLTPAEVLALEPGVRPEGLTGGAVYFDGQCEPERLCLEFLRGAVAHGAVAVNYARVCALACRRGRLDDVEIEDLVTGRRVAVRAAMVVNVAGPWADGIDHLCGAGDEVVLRRSKGIHVVTRRLTGEHALVLRTREGGHLFLVPWRGQTLIGTTDVLYTGPLDELSVTAEDVDGLLAQVNEAQPSAALTPADVRYRYAGVRPLVEQETKVYQASRRYEIVDHHRRGTRGLISAVGGKYTTSRNLARKLTDRVLLHLGRPAVRCLTASLPLPCAPPLPLGPWVDAQVAACRELPEDVVRHLAHWWGRGMERIVTRVRREPALGERVVDSRPEILAEVAEAVEGEMALTLCDALSRRTGIATAGHPGDEALDRVARLAGGLLGWDGAEIERQKRLVEDKILGRPERAFTPPGGTAGCGTAA